MFSKVLQLRLLNIHTVDGRKHTTHGRVDLSSLGRLHPREGGVFEDTPIHISHHIEWRTYDTNGQWIMIKIDEVGFFFL